ncbi:IclR family transcriptional regulator [Tomitella gaofuii]|uniref:IclR family transcriptional regulator n=1 Tax=Tomitella gaofuii TaxID=2760083 RepID=UPI0015F96DBE|nr:helix-turn-helix domain-containing protein [Tomitella gaofuii]
MTITLDARLTGGGESADAPSTQLDRISLILESFDGHAQQSLSDVTRRTGLPRSTAHRMLERLVHMQWVRKDGRDYELGARLIELGSLAASQSRLHAAALPVMRELQRVTGHMVYLGVLDGDDVLYTQRIGNPRGRVAPARVGGRCPARLSPIGLCLLAFAPQSADPGAGAALDPQLARVREDGVAYVDSGDAFGIGAPIGEAGHAVGALSICAPGGELRQDHRLAAPVRMAAASIMHSLTRRDAGVVPVLPRRQPLRTLPSAGLRHAAHGA